MGLPRVAPTDDFFITQKRINTQQHSEKVKYLDILKGGEDYLKPLMGKSYAPTPPRNPL